MFLCKRDHLRSSIFSTVLIILILMLLSCAKPDKQAGDPSGLEKKNMNARDTILADRTKQGTDNDLQAVKTETATFSLG